MRLSEIMQRQLEAVAPEQEDDLPEPKFPPGPILICAIQILRQFDSNRDWSRLDELDFGDWAVVAASVGIAAKLIGFAPGNEVSIGVSNAVAKEAGTIFVELPDGSIAVNDDQIDAFCTEMEAKEIELLTNANVRPFKKTAASYIWEEFKSKLPYAADRAYELVVAAPWPFHSLLPCVQASAAASRTCGAQILIGGAAPESVVNALALMFS